MYTYKIQISDCGMVKSAGDIHAKIELYTIDATNYSYNDRGFLTSISNPSFGETLAYSDGGNTTYYNGSIYSDSCSYPGAQSGISNYTYTYSYDANNRMTNATNSANSAYSFTSIVYDNNGNVESRNDGSTPVSFTYSGSDIPIAYTNNGVVDDMTYDRDGNNLGNYYNNPGAISYDPFTLLTQGIDERDIVTDNFEYDGSKERVLNTYNNGGTQTTTLYLHGTNSYPLEEMTSSSTDYYVYGPAGLIAFINGGATYFVLKDHLGSTQVVLNSSNSPQSWYSYTPYGGTWQSTVSGNAGVAFEFTGQELEQGGDLYNFRAREYDPALGIFYASDPAGQGFSPYMYVDGNPVNLVDPTGMWSWNKFWKDLGWGAAFVGSFFTGPFEPIATAAVIGAYAGGAAYNNTFNPGNFNYNSAGTWLWMAGGAAAGGLAANAIAFQQGLQLTVGITNGGSIDLGTIGGTTLSGVTGGALAGGAVTGAMTLNDLGIPQVIAGGIESWWPVNSDAPTLGSMGNGPFGGNGVPPLVSLFANCLGGAYNGISSEALSFEQMVSDAYLYDEVGADISGLSTKSFENVGMFFTGFNALNSGIEYFGAQTEAERIQAGGDLFVSSTSGFFERDPLTAPIGAGLELGYSIGEQPFFQQIGRSLAPYSQPIYNWVNGR